MPAAPIANPLPPDVRLMNAVSALRLAGLLLLAAGLLLRWVTRLPAFAIRAIVVEGDVTRNSVASLRANALPKLSGSFLSMNLQNGRHAFEAVPWVRRATVQRVWPNRLRVKLEEHQPAAYWEAVGVNAQSGASAELLLVNSFGELFQANLGDVEDEKLPILAGPNGKSAALLQMWKRLQSLAEPLEEHIDRLDLSGRGSWRLTLENGAVIEIGRGSDDEVLARFGQFVRTREQITSRYKTQVLSADLRHGDGYAVRLRGISTTATPGKPGLAGARN